MRIETHKSYDKMWVKLNHKQQLKVLATLKMFLGGQNGAKLRIHQLKGKYYPQYSISVSGDLHIHFLKINDDTIVLTMVGTHSQLYH